MTSLRAIRESLGLDTSLKPFSVSIAELERQLHALDSMYLELPRNGREYCRGVYKLQEKATETINEIENSDYPEEIVIEALSRVNDILGEVNLIAGNTWLMTRYGPNLRASVC
ncbi:predicted protein [Uncinocarpus reesii 1704]|uniref:Uncharacterized protein n=1 Tax=Uncinocarpus reesii (strain UAMH 1704) TaxID=336963 RepID=C4JV31_UNCRE|nr:uncharacterized protein UREG_04984 [Uncinocarpus reesii 1704]EEP80142.1 predicted protein [Uncinocarpus reesii 1704]